MVQQMEIIYDQIIVSSPTLCPKQHNNLSLQDAGWNSSLLPTTGTDINFE